MSKIIKELLQLTTLQAAHKLGVMKTFPGGGEILREPSTPSPPTDLCAASLNSCQIHNFASRQQGVKESAYQPRRSFLIKNQLQIIPIFVKD